MNTASTVNTGNVIPPIVSSVQEIPLARICESKTNPRRQFDETKLSELADNIRQHGVLQAILVRRLSDGEADSFELVAGARRYRMAESGRNHLSAVPSDYLILSLRTNTSYRGFLLCSQAACSCRQPPARTQTLSASFANSLRRAVQHDSWPISWSNLFEICGSKSCRIVISQGCI